MPSPLPACPCRPDAPGQPRYEDCCGRYHAGPLQLRAPTPEALMRSRYTAFVQGRSDYLLATWHAATRPAEIEADPPGLRWLGLEVRRSALQDERHATVEFVARNKLGGRAQRLHEVSRFVKEGDEWLYVDGQTS